MIVKEIDLFFDGASDPVYEIAWMGLQVGPKTFVDLFVQYNDLWKFSVDVFNNWNLLRKREHA